MITGNGYYEGILLIGQISAEPHYQLSKIKLIDEFLEGNNWLLKDLVDYSDIDDRILYRYRHDEIKSPIKNKEMLKRICIALGLDLVNSFILISKSGMYLNPINNLEDKKFMEFVNSNNELYRERIFDYDDYMESIGS